MALLKCKQCGGEVESNAASCPKCGAPPPRGASAKRLVLALGVIGFGICCFFIGIVLTLGKGGSATMAWPWEAKTATEVPILTLLSEYKDNQVRADLSYKGQLIQTSGNIDEVRRDVMGSPYIMMGTGDRFESPKVDCYFAEKHIKQAAALTHGKLVTVRGRVDGLLVDIVIKDCELVNL